MKISEQIGEKITNLINVKTIVTFIVTAVFAILSIRREIEAEVVMTVVTMILSFYFGTQHEKQTRQEKENNPAE